MRHVCSAGLFPSSSTHWSLLVQELLHLMEMKFHLGTYKGQSKTGWNKLCPTHLLCLEVFEVKILETNFTKTYKEKHPNYLLLWFGNFMRILALRWQPTSVHHDKSCWCHLFCTGAAGVGVDDTEKVHLTTCTSSKTMCAYNCQPVLWYHCTAIKAGMPVLGREGCLPATPRMCSHGLQAQPTDPDCTQMPLSYIVLEPTVARFGL